MSVTVECNEELEIRLRREADQVGLDLNLHITRVLEQHLERAERQRCDVIVASLPPKEAELLHEINAGLPHDVWAQYGDLLLKDADRILTTPERLAQIALSDRIKENDAARMAVVAELARQRRVSSDMLARELGLLQLDLPKPDDADPLERLFQSYRWNSARSEELAAFAVRERRQSMPADNDTFISGVEADVVRAAIVFAHAALDDFLRSVGRLRFRNLPGDVLSNVPLMGTNTTKFTLGALAPHQNVAVSDLIQVSVDDYLSRRSFNSSGEIMTFLHLLDIQCPDARSVLPWIAELMSRRHKVVHRADVPDALQANVPLELRFEDVIRCIVWIRASSVLAYSILLELAPDDMKARVSEALGGAEGSLRLARETLRDGNAPAPHLRVAR